MIAAYKKPVNTAHKLVNRCDIIVRFTQRMVNRNDRVDNRIHRWNKKNVICR